MTTPEETQGSSRTGEPDRAAFAAFFEQSLRQPIFVILGVQGSGTNLFRRLIDGALNFSVVQDQSVVYNAALKLGPRPSRAAVIREFEGLLSRMLPSALGRKTLRRVKSNGSFQGIDRVFDPSLVRSGEELARFIYAYSAYSRGSTRMAIKSDDLWETIEHIDKVLPNRRIILLTRDFRDNLLSITKKDFGPRDPLVAAAYVKERFAYYDAEYQRTAPERRLHVTFEEMLDDPDGFLSRFWTHFALGADADAPGPVDTGPIRRNNKRKWASLTPRELANVEGTLRAEMTRYGYEPETGATAEPGAGAWFAARTRDTLKRVPQKLQKIVKRLQK